MKKLTVIKVGGAVVEDARLMPELLRSFSDIEGCKILVHGGGRSATQMAERLGVETVMVEGRRVTSAEMLKIATMVYAGEVNKNIVAGLQALGCDALGVTGADGGIIKGHRREVKKVDYGHVGDVDCVNGKALHQLLSAGFVPVVAPLIHDGKGNLLNTNADTIASEVARGMIPYYDVTLVYCFEKPGVLADPDDDGSVIGEITAEKFAALKADGTVSGGMIPKIDNSLDAVTAGVKEVIITSAGSLEDLSAGTHIR
ncbi:MAG: acetylglutamate kinase [Muribaculaceae bacterium]|nr:acetylglutamate kinase [Muribaculaceae bacterium]